MSFVSKVPCIKAKIHMVELNLLYFTVFCDIISSTMFSLTLQQSVCQTTGVWLKTTVVRRLGFKVKLRLLLPLLTLPWVELTL